MKTLITYFLVLIPIFYWNTLLGLNLAFAIMNAVNGNFLFFLNVLTIAMAIPICNVDRIRCKVAIMQIEKASVQAKSE